MYSRILVPLDGSKFAEAALPYALALAGRWGAALEVATVAGEAERGGEGSPEEGATGEGEGGFLANAYLGSVVDRIRAGGHRGEVHPTVLPPGEVGQRLVEALDRSGADLAVMTTHGRGAIRRAWLGSAADSFIRRSPIPILLLRSGEGAAADPSGSAGSIEAHSTPFQRVLVPLDGSAASERLVELSLPFVGEGEARCLLLRVVAPFIPGGSPYFPHLVPGAGAEELVRDGAQAYLDACAGRLPDGCAVTHIRTGGDPAAAILETAREEGVDLIALATAGRGGVTRMLLGSVAEKVVRGATVPILVYRNPEG